jgi:Flp pilus assembly protein TadD
MAFWRQRGALVVAALLVASCAARDDTKQDKLDLTDSLLAAAASARSQDDPVSAANYYRTAFAGKPDSAEAAVGLMQSLRVIGGLDEANTVADQAVAAEPKSEPVLAEAGKVKLAFGAIAASIDLLQRASAEDAKDWRVRSALGLCYDRLGDFGKADASYKAALAISPDNASILNNYGLSRVMANDLPGARELLQRAVLLPNADIRVRQNLALVYALSGDMGKAEELTRRDLPPALVGATLEYYRQLAAAAPPSH